MKKVALRKLERPLHGSLAGLAAIGWASLSPLACSSASTQGQAGPDGGSHDASLEGASSVEDADAGDGTDASSDSSTGSEAGTGTTEAGTDAHANGDAGLAAGWLYTSGGAIYVSNGASAPTRWMGRGVNLDDIFLCGYNDTLSMTSPDQTLETMIGGLMSAWKPTFVRISLAMDSNPTVASWVGTNAQYKTPMTNVINAVGTYPGVHVLVTLRSDASMIGQDTADGDPEATGLPSSSTTTPNATSFPSGTDSAYVALVDSFANASFVMFGLTNEPGGDKLSNDAIASALKHSVGVIRAEEDRLGVPHHIVSVQGNGWTSDISFYAATDGGAGLIGYDNVVYEVHGYPPSAASYTYSNIPVIIGEYGDLSDATTFYADVEAKQIPNMAWDFESYSNCAPDLVTVNDSATNLVPTAWGTTVQNYLLAHAQ